MAGILGNSVSVVMTTSTTDQVESGYVTGEQILLSTNPAGLSYLWSASVPQGSAAGRSAIVGVTDPNPKIVPDVPGTYLITCLVNGATFYQLRLTVVALSVSQSTQATRYSPVADASVPAPAAGVCLYYSSDQGGLVVKNPDGSVHVVTVS
jgi:hypothetical protein